MEVLLYYFYNSMTKYTIFLLNVLIEFVFILLYCFANLPQQSSINSTNLSVRLFPIIISY